MADVQELIAEARARVVVSRVGKLTSRETDKDLVIINRLVSALEAATSPVEPEGGVVERVARHLANLHDGESWPGNSELGGSLTGTRDDEYRAAMENEAREILALTGFSHRVGGETECAFKINGRGLVTHQMPPDVARAFAVASPVPIVLLERQVTPWAPVSPQQDTESSR